LNEEVEAIKKRLAREAESQHQAAGTQPAPDGASEGVVLTELKPGYFLGDRLIRPATGLVGCRPSPDEAFLSEDRSGSEGRSGADGALHLSRPTGEKAWRHREGPRRS
jgi:hypothetical protein